MGGGGGGRGAKPRVGRCALGVGRCVFRGLGQDFAKMVHFRPSENLENNFRQHCTTRVPTYQVLLTILQNYKYICDKTRTRTEWVGGWVCGWSVGGWLGGEVVGG